MRCAPLIPAVWRLRQEDHQLKASIVISHPTPKKNFPERVRTEGEINLFFFLLELGLELRAFTFTTPPALFL
jgi:hypothetical protein